MKFAVEKLNVDPDVTNFFLGLYVVIAVAGIGVLIWHITPILIRRSRAKRAAKLKFNHEIWFDGDESELRRGARRLKIPESTLEFFVCRAVFSEKEQYQLDINLIEEAGMDIFKTRAVYQAVTRLNKKAKSELGVEELFIRGREKTGLNSKYR